MADVYDVANYFRYRLGLSEGSSLTHLKLQKLVYYAQAWSLVLLDQRLFDGKFEARAHGPVNRELFDRYHEYKWMNIEPIEDGQDNIATAFTQGQLEVLEDVWNIYGEYDAKYLERLTHQELPWQEARGDVVDGATCYTQILENTMKDFYSSLLAHM